MKTFEEDHKDREAAKSEAAAKPAAAKPAAAAPPAPSPAAKPDLPVFRINITIFIMCLTCLLLGIIVHNSGRSKTLQLPRALVFVLDGVNGVDVQNAALHERAPFVQMLSEVGSSTLTLGPRGCTHFTTDDSGLIRELFTGTPFSRASVLMSAIDAGLGVTVIGDYPLLDDQGGAGCGALNAECPQSCLSLPADGGRCNYRAAFREKRMASFLNTTLAAFLARGSQLVVVRIPVVPIDPTNQMSKDSALYLADSAVGRTAMAILERTAVSGENLLVAIAAANASEPSAFLSISAFRAAGQIKLRPITSTPSRPAQLGDLTSTLATWFGLDTTAYAVSIPQAVCGLGSAGADCV